MVIKSVRHPSPYKPFFWVELESTQIFRGHLSLFHKKYCYWLNRVNSWVCGPMLISKFHFGLFDLLPTLHVAICHLKCIFVLDSFRRKEAWRPRMWANEVSCSRSWKYVMIINKVSLLFWVWAGYWFLHFFYVACTLIHVI